MYTNRRQCSHMEMVYLMLASLEIRNHGMRSGQTVEHGDDSHFMKMSGTVNI